MADPREPRPDGNAFGMLAEFEDAQTIRNAAHAAREAGFTHLDAFTPYPVDGLAEAIGFRDRRVPLMTLLGGLFGGILGLGLQIYTNLDYPLDIGGRPVIAFEGFAIIAVALAMLFAVVFAILGLFAFNGLPRLHHPLFSVEGFERATSDRFFLLILANDARFERARTFLESVHPLRIAPVGHTEEPE